MKLYSAKNPEQIAALFTRNADEADKRSNSAKSQRDKRFHDGQRAAWRDAAAIINATDFVGWKKKD